MSTFIIPMPPKPDARLHLGHAAGPYISADMTARAMRLFGKACHFLSGIEFLRELGFQRFHRAIGSDGRRQPGRSDRTGRCFFSIKN